MLAETGQPWTPSITVHMAALALSNSVELWLQFNPLWGH